VRGYTIEDIKVGMKIRDKDDDKTYGIITDIEDVHNVEVIIYNNKGEKVGFGLYCFDKLCQYEYMGGKIDIINDDNGELQK
jgi:translation elongation factor EF-1beta